MTAPRKIAPFRDAVDQAIAARIVIGVTGHRKLENPISLGDAVQSALQKIRQMAPELESTPLLFSVLSPLAEGADRLITIEVLKNAGSLLEVVLPMEKEEYVKDFQTDDSKKEFEELISRTNIIRILSPKSSKEEAYERVGHYIVEQCDVLIALWDGKPSAGRGGTEEIVRYARDTKCPLVWINAADSSQISFETGRGLDPRPFLDLDDYNLKRVTSKGFDTRFNRDIRLFSDQVKRAGLPPDKVLPTIEFLLKRYIRGDKLALDIQHLYYRAETVVHSLALAAVMIAAFQVLFLPDLPVILISEIALMLAVLGIVWIGRRQRWHDRWIDYRFLAERFRSALFMAIANVDVAILRPPRHLSLSYSPKDWMVAAFSTVWRMKPRIPADDGSLFEGVKQFLCEAWINDQIFYHEGTSKRHLGRHRRMTAVSYVLFGLTIAVAVAHIAKVGPPFLETVFAFLAVVFPAIAASITAMKTHRDYLRTSMRSGEMVLHLKELKDKMSRAENRDEFLVMVKETEETMLHENEDWRVVVRFHKTDVPG